MEYFVVYLECKRYLVLPKNWIKNPVPRQRSTVFFSGDTSSTPSFICEKKYYVNNEVGACYDAFILKSFDSYDDAQRFAINKRLSAPVMYKSSEKYNFSPGTEPVDFVEISDTDTSMSDSNQSIDGVQAHPQENESVDDSFVAVDNVESAPSVFGNDIQQEESNDGQSLETESEDHFDDTGSDESHITQVNSGINENDITDSDTDTDKSTDGDQGHPEKNELVDDSQETHAQSTSLDAVDNDDTGPTGQQNLPLSNIQHNIKKIKIKLEQENESLRKSLKKLNERIGDEIIDDSESSLDEESEEHENFVNTRYYQIDEQFASKHYFITNDKGDRYYLDEGVKLNLNLVMILKKMNVVYPKTSSDFDLEFMRRLLRAIFTTTELENCASSSSLKKLNPSKLRFAKDVYRNRVGDDENRFNAFRRYAIEIGRE